MKLGYARVSTQEQNLALQLDFLKNIGCDKIYQEKISGASAERPELKKLLELIREGDTLSDLEAGSPGSIAGPFDCISCGFGTASNRLIESERSGGYHHGAGAVNLSHFCQPGRI